MTIAIHFANNCEVGMLGLSTIRIHLSETQDLTVGSKEEGYGRGGDSLKAQLAAT